jgi:Mrp family chromosome partitioning ATPase
MPIRTLLVTSAVPEEGKSTVVRNLGLSYAEAGARVAVIEADLRRPSLSKTLGTDPGPGLADVLMGVRPLDSVVQTVHAHTPAPIVHGADGVTVEEKSVRVTGASANGNGSHGDLEGLHLIASGPRPADPPAMFAAPALQSLLERVSADYDMVIIDSPPLLAVSDAIPLLSLVDGTILVCRVGISTVDAAERVLSLIERVPGMRTLGLVVNDVESGFGDRYAGY